MGVLELRVTRPDGLEISTSHAVTVEEQRLLRGHHGAVWLRVNDETIVLPRRVLRGVLSLLGDDL